jgi:hypothetical protein
MLTGEEKGSLFFISSKHCSKTFIFTPIKDYKKGDDDRPEILQI